MFLFLSKKGREGLPNSGLFFGDNREAEADHVNACDWVLEWNKLKLLMSCTFIEHFSGEFSGL